jgi:hypothetical protein
MANKLASVFRVDAERSKNGNGEHEQQRNELYALPINAEREQRAPAR